MFKYKKAVPMLLGLILILTAASVVAGDKEPKKLTNAAVVNGVPISFDTYQRELNLYKNRLQRRGMKLDDAQKEQVKKEVINNLINQELLFQESGKQGIRITDAKVAAAYKAIADRYADPKRFENALSQMGLNEKKLKQEIGRREAIRALIDKEIGPNVTVGDDEAKQFFDNNPNLFKQAERVKASHILIKLDEKDGDQADAKAKEKLAGIRKKALAGEDFAQLAKAHSQGPSSSRGGDLGYFGRGQMVKPFETAAFALKPNEISDLVKTRFGYHLIKVTDRQPEKTFAYDEVKEKLKTQLRNKKMQQEMVTYLVKLRKDANISQTIP